MQDKNSKKNNFNNNVNLNDQIINLSTSEFIKIFGKKTMRESLSILRQKHMEQLLIKDNIDDSGKKRNTNKEQNKLFVHNPYNLYQPQYLQQFSTNLSVEQMVAVSLSNNLDSRSLHRSNTHQFKL